MTRYNVFTVEEYSYKNQKRRKFHKVGRMVENAKSGYALFIPPGISVTGRLVIFPEDQTEEDILRHYDAAADKYDP